jgi:hypothetical protein
MAKRIITVKLTLIEADALLWRAGEGSPECFDHEPNADELAAAAERAMDKIASQKKTSA